MSASPIRTLLCSLMLAACSSSSSSPSSSRLRLWHTFNPTETEALNVLLADRADPVEPTLLPFARGQTIIHEVLTGTDDCPDLIRIDATWLPGLVAADLLKPVPEPVARSRSWVPEAAELAMIGGNQYALPQSIDGLALIYRESTVKAAGVAWPPETVGELITTARRLTRDGNHGLGVRVDGYWFATFLRAWGGDVLDPGTGALGIDTAQAREALIRFAAFFTPGGISPTPPPTGNEAQDEARRFRNESLAVAINGPWAVTELSGGDNNDLAVAPFPRDPTGRAAAPRGGQLFVVPRCTRSEDTAWRLAIELTAPGLQADWARRFGVVPTSERGLADAGAFSQQFYRALKVTRPLPRHPITSELFDDLNPAIAAVVSGDATAEEALAGVARAWRRLLRRHGLTPVDWQPSGADAGAGQ